MFKTLLAKRVKKLADPTVINMLKHASSPDIISLGGGVPNPKLFPKKEVKQVIKDIVANELDSVLQYSITSGIPLLRNQIANYYSTKWGKQLTSDNVLITTGSQQAIDLLAKAFLDESRDSIIVEDPTYLIAISAFNTYDPTYQIIKFENGQPDLKNLEKILQKNNSIKFIYAIPTFQNPTGQTWNESTRKSVLKLIKKYKVLFLEDNPYGEIYFDEEPPQDISSMDESGLSIFLGTFSKTLMPGLRVGFIIAEPKLIKTLTLIKQSMDMHSPVFSQLLVAKLLAKEGFYKSHLEKLREYYSKNANYLLKLIEKHLSEHVTWNSPNGGLFVWVKNKNISCKDLYKKAIKEKVAFMPGYAFYANETDEFTLRLTFSTATKNEMEVAILRLKSCFEQK